MTQRPVFREPSRRSSPRAFKARILRITVVRSRPRVAPFVSYEMTPFRSVVVPRKSVLPGHTKPPAEQPKK